MCSFGFLGAEWILMMLKVSAAPGQQGAECVKDEHITLYWCGPICRLVHYFKLFCSILGARRKSALKNCALHAFNYQTDAG